MSKPHDVHPAACPRCGYRLDCASIIAGQEDARPKPGDFSLCVRCGQLLRFDDDLEPVLAFARELDELPRDVQALLRRASLLAPIAWARGERRVKST